MTGRHVPKLALALLERVVPDSAPLAGDLIEEFERGRSAGWVWWQVSGAIVAALLERPAEIRPLRLVELQPADAVERSRRMHLRFRPLNPSGTPLASVGSVGLAMLVVLLTVVAPAAWLALLGSALAGLMLGVARIAMRAGSPAAPTRTALSLRVR